MTLTASSTEQTLCVIHLQTLTVSVLTLSAPSLTHVDTNKQHHQWTIPCELSTSTGLLLTLSPPSLTYDDTDSIINRPYLVGHLQWLASLDEDTILCPDPSADHDSCGRGQA